MTLSLDGQLALSWLDLDDFRDLGAEEAYSEGIIDTLRTISGVRIAALLRERCRDGVPEYKGSLRSADGSVNVASIAHVWSGGGHVQAAGFTAFGELEEIVQHLEQEAALRL